MAAETTSTMDAVLKIGYLQRPTSGGRSLERIRRRRLLQEELRAEKERSLSRMRK